MNAITQTEANALQAPPGASLGRAITLQAHQINADSARNPRQTRNAADYGQLRASVKALGGIFSPVTVRPPAEPGGQYLLNAGFSRYDILVELYGIDVFVPCMLLEGCEVDAEIIATTENLVRSAMTPLDIAESAERALVTYKDDKATVARLHGMGVAGLNRMLALTQLVPAARKALRALAFSVGHAELIATLRSESQEKVLHWLDENPAYKANLGGFKAIIEGMLLKLDKAIFDKSDCVGCKFATANQQALFAEVLTEGNCTNKACYDGKTEQALQAKADGLKDDYQVIKIIRPGDQLVAKPLLQDGVRGVGVEQAAACRTCANFGAIVSAVPDTLGKVEKEMCMDQACMMRKIAARVKSETPPPQEGASSSASTGGVPTGGKAGATASANRSTSGSSSAAPAGLSSAVTKYRESVWRMVFATVAARADAVTSKAVLLTVLLHRPSVLSADALGTALKPLGLERCSINLTKTLRTALDLSDQQLSMAMAQAAASADGLEIRAVVEILKVLEVRLEDHWKLCSAYLATLTKNEIDAIARELKLEKALGKEYPKLLGGRKDDLIKGLLSITDLDYKGLVPRQMRW